MRHVACNQDACANRGAPYTMEAAGSPPCPFCAIPMDSVVLAELLAAQELERADALAVVEEPPTPIAEPPVDVLPDTPILEMPGA